MPSSSSYAFAITQRPRTTASILYRPPRLEGPRNMKRTRRKTLDFIALHTGPPNKKTGVTKGVTQSNRLPDYVVL